MVVGDKGHLSHFYVLVVQGKLRVLGGGVLVLVLESEVVTLGLLLSNLLLLLLRLEAVGLIIRLLLLLLLLLPSSDSRHWPLETLSHVLL